MPTQILIAVDPTDDLEGLRDVLTSMGYEVVVAKAGHPITVSLDDVRLMVETVVKERV